jgi:hypothetical protein
MICSKIDIISTPDINLVVILSWLIVRELMSVRGGGYVIMTRFSEIIAVSSTRDVLIMLWLGLLKSFPRQLYSNDSAFRNEYRFFHTRYQSYTVATQASGINFIYPVPFVRVLSLLTECIMWRCWWLYARRDFYIFLSLVLQISLHFLFIPFGGNGYEIKIFEAYAGTSKYVGNNKKEL